LLFRHISLLFSRSGGQELTDKQRIGEIEENALSETPALITRTLLFTDIEGSTRRWEEATAEMRALLREHDRLLDDAITRHHGVVFKTVGDAFYAVFDAVSDALAAVIDAHQALKDLSSGMMQPLRVRMALHTGEVEHRGNDYFGPPMNRVARVLGLAHGGQTLITQTTQHLLQSLLPSGVSCTDMGLHRLRGLQIPEHIYQLNLPGMPATFPPLHAEDYIPGNIQPRLTNFIGRERDLHEAISLLRRTRCLTLTGIGGTGKTRLALQVTDTLAADYPDGAWFVDLAPITECDMVAQTVAITLGVSLEGHRHALPELQAILRTKRLLLILDNCEHLLATCSDLVGQLLIAAPQLTIVATSREPLRIPGETVYRVPPLSCPPPDDSVITPETLLTYEAACLFLDRASTVTPGFTLTADNASAVAQLCWRLDGLPLAIELATARLRAMTVAQIVSRLDDRFRLLTGGSRIAMPRQQTLRALIDWSYDLLTPAEQALLRRLAVFTGGWTLEAAEAICADEILDSLDVVDILIELVEKSLVIADSFTGDAMRYSMLEVVRQYSDDQLRAAGEEHAFHARHAHFFLEQVEREKREIANAATAEVWKKWAEYNVVEADNFRAALRQACVGLEGFPLALTFFRRLPRECHHWLDVLLARDTGVNQQDRAEALLWAAHVCQTHAEARPYVEESLGIYQHLCDLTGVCECLRTLSRHAVGQGEMDRAKQLRDTCERIAAESSNPEIQVHACITAVVIALAEGHPEDARPRIEHAITLRRAMQMPREVAFFLVHQATVELLEGHLERARALGEESLCLFQQTGNPAYMPTLRLLGDVARAQQHFGEALMFYRKSIEDHWRQVDSYSTILLLERIGYVESQQDQACRAIRWLAIADLLRQRDAYPRNPVEQTEWDNHLARLTPLISTQDFTRYWCDSQAEDPSNILGDVLASLTVTGPDISTSSR
jgi:predicted ATPase/class 3 adenylate cyclase